MFTKLPKTPKLFRTHKKKKIGLSAQMLTLNLFILDVNLITNHISGANNLLQTEIRISNDSLASNLTTLAQKKKKLNWLWITLKFGKWLICLPYTICPVSPIQKSWRRKLRQKLKCFLHFFFFGICLLTFGFSVKPFFCKPIKSVIQINIISNFDKILQWVLVSCVKFNRLKHEIQTNSNQYLVPIKMTIFKKQSKNASKTQKIDWCDDGWSSSALRWCLSSFSWEELQEDPTTLESCIYSLFFFVFFCFFLNFFPPDFFPPIVLIFFSFFFWILSFWLERDIDLSLFVFFGCLRF